MGMEVIDDLKKHFVAVSRLDLYPCKDCTTAMRQSMLFDEVTCFNTCKDYAEWQNKREQVEERRRETEDGIITEMNRKVS